jgi:hypothetical protein
VGVISNYTCREVYHALVSAESIQPPRPEQIVARLQTVARRCYRLGRVFPSALDVAYGTDSADVHVATSNLADPTAGAATDRSKAQLRVATARAADLIELADRATAKALRDIQQADRLPGEAVGRSWNTGSAQDAEDRSARRRGMQGMPEALLNRLVAWSASTRTRRRSSARALSLSCGTKNNSITKGTGTCCLTAIQFPSKTCPGHLL